MAFLQCHLVFVFTLISVDASAAFKGTLLAGIPPAAIKHCLWKYEIWSIFVGPLERPWMKTGSDRTEVLLQMISLPVISFKEVWSEAILKHSVLFSLNVLPPQMLSRLVLVSAVMYTPKRNSWDLLPQIKIKKKALQVKNRNLMIKLIFFSCKHIFFCWQNKVFKLLCE